LLPCKFSSPSVSYKASTGKDTAQKREKYTKNGTL